MPFNKIIEKQYTYRQPQKHQIQILVLFSLNTPFHANRTGKADELTRLYIFPEFFWLYFLWVRTQGVKTEPYY